MGNRLANFFREAEQLAGIQGKVRLAILAMSTSTQAKTEPDTPEAIERFEKALLRLRDEFRKGPADQLDTARSGKEVEQHLRNHARAFSELLSQRELFIGDLQKTSSRVTEVISAAVDVERASIWLYDDRKSYIECVDLFERASGVHSGGIRLKAEDYPRYFESLEHERTIAAHDAHQDPRTRDFSESYLKPLGIVSMLDVPIWTGHRMVGVVCHEHVGAIRQWNADEENFAFVMSNIVALSMEYQHSRVPQGGVPG